MKSWMQDDAKRDFPTLDRVLWRIMFEADKNLKILPELELGRHWDCFKAICKSMRTALDDDNLPDIVPAQIITQCHDHARPDRGTEATWNLIIQVNVWKMIEGVATALHGAQGHGIVTPLMGGRAEVHGNDCLLYGLTAAMAHFHCIRHCALNPDTTWKTPFSEKYTTLAGIPGLGTLSDSRPQWVVDLLDQGLPDGAPRLSDRALGFQINVLVPRGSGLESVKSGE